MLMVGENKKCGQRGSLQQRVCEHAGKDTEAKRVSGSDQIGVGDAEKEWVVSSSVVDGTQGPGVFVGDYGIKDRTDLGLR